MVRPGTQHGGVRRRGWPRSETHEGPDRELRPDRRGELELIWSTKLHATRTIGRYSLPDLAMRIGLAVPDYAAMDDLVMRLPQLGGVSGPCETSAAV